MADKEEGGNTIDGWFFFEWFIIIALAVHIISRIIAGISAAIERLAIMYLGPDSVLRHLIADPSWYALQRVGETSIWGTILHVIVVSGRYLLLALAVLLIGICVYLFRKIVALSASEPVIPEVTGAALSVDDDPLKQRWKKIVEHSQSENPGDWRLGILEADIILDEILDINGYRGDTLGEKLKAVERSDMPSLDMAWEAHKIRNAIAHEGAQFVLTDREARRVIRLYEAVFRDFKII